MLSTALCAALFATAGAASGRAQAAMPGAGSVINAGEDYVIGPEDQLSVLFFSNRDMSADVVVRPDGKISLPLINEVTASGLTPEQLREQVTLEAKRFIQEPNPTIVIRQINSRKVFITGAVEKPGTYSLNGPTTVLQLIATAAGLKEYADSKHIAVIRTEHGRQNTYPFNYDKVIDRKSMEQNIQLRPGDTVIVR
ncbi:MAG: polysaccharide biosynthesis/export family protein [Acidobacteriota bacterium]